MPQDRSASAEKPTRQWAAWTHQEEQSFFNALRLEGKNFEKITLRVQSKNKDQLQPQPPHLHLHLTLRLHTHTTQSATASQSAALASKWSKKKNQRTVERGELISCGLAASDDRSRLSQKSMEEKRELWPKSRSPTTRRRRRRAPPPYRTGRRGRERPLTERRPRGELRHGAAVLDAGGCWCCWRGMRPPWNDLRRQLPSRHRPPPPQPSACPREEKRREEESQE
uniref:SANT domain-containing protein n=1 Tax=Oryza nivara TaxID=4536 RepID=A0A0E0I1J1_ORYNI